MQEEMNNVESVPEEPIQTENVNDNPYATETQSIAIAPKSNLAAGLVGAFLGSLVGVVAWFIIYQLGFIAGLAGLIAAVCAMKGYEKFGKVLDKKGVISCIIIVLIVIFLANKLCWTWEIYQIYQEEGFTFFDSFIYADQIISFSDATGYYYLDLLIGYALTAWASYKNIIEAFKQAN